MLKLNFVCNWEKKNRSLLWSGTPFGLFSSLKKICDLNDVSLVDSYRDIQYRNLIKVKNHLKLGNSFGIENIDISTRQFENSKIAVSSPCLVFHELETSHIEDTYIFLDCSVDYLLRLKLNRSKLVKFSPLPSQASVLIIRKRNAMQLSFLRKCKGIFVMSEWLRNDLTENTKIDGNKVHVVGGGCNIDVSKIDYSKKNGKRFLFIGKDWERKNGPLVVKAFEKLELIYPDVELYISGPENLPSFQSKNIHFLGRLSYDELSDLYNRCDFFVMPSAFEAYGLVFAEALIFGLPCIGKNEFAMPEFIENNYNGYLLSEDSENELFEIMEKMLKNADILKKNCLDERLQYQLQYSWASVAKRITNILKLDGY